MDFESVVTDEVSAFLDIAAHKDAKESVGLASKNGYLLLNVGPKPDGTIPEEARRLLLGIGKWLKVNGEAIYETSPWVIAGEGPTRLGRTGMFSESDIKYTAEDIRHRAPETG